MVRVMRDFDVLRLGDERAQERNTKIHYDIAEALIPRSIFVSPTLDFKLEPFKPLGLGMTQCTRYIC